MPGQAGPVPPSRTTDATLKKGVLTKERAIELLGCLFIKLSEFVPLFSDNIAVFFSGFPANPAITFGGLTPDGEDATNELDPCHPRHQGGPEDQAP